MYIKVIPETEAERKRFGGAESVDHANVKEYILIGNKLDGDGALVDFHEWNGAFRYLLGTLSYFYEVINDDRRKRIKTEDVELPMVLGSEGKPFVPMIKRGEGGKVIPLDIASLKPHPMATLKNAPKTTTNATIEDEFEEQVQNGLEDMEAQDEEQDAPPERTTTPFKTRPSGGLGGQGGLKIVK